MKRLATPLYAALVLSAATVSAQTTFRLGVRGGVNQALTTQAAASNYSESTPGYVFTYAANKSATYAWQAGAVAEIGFGKISLQPALLFSQKGETAHTVTDLQSTAGYYYDSSQRDITNRYNWLELPLNVVYTAYADHGWQLFGGPYVALAVGGHRKGTVSNNSSGVAGPYSYSISEPIEYGDGATNKRLDIGVNFGIGYRQGPMQVQLGYGLGLRNLRQAGPSGVDPGFFLNFHNFDADAAYNRVAQLTGTYFFAL